MQVWSESSTAEVSQVAPGFGRMEVRRVPPSRVRVFMKRGECAVTAASDTVDLDIDLTRHMLRQGRARALVVGTEGATGAVLSALRDDFGSPVLHVRAGGPLTLPETPATLLIHDVSALDRHLGQKARCIARSRCSKSRKTCSILDRPSTRAF